MRVPETSQDFPRLPAGSHRLPARTISSARGKSGSLDFGAGNQQSTEAEARAARLWRTIAGAGDGATEADLWEASPYRIDWLPGVFDALALIKQLYRPEDHLFVGDRYARKVHRACDVATHIETRGRVPWPHIAPNPFTGEPAETKTGTQSFRCDAAVTWPAPFCLVEFDGIPRERQLAFWVGVISMRLLDVAAVIDTAGKSLHGWVRVAAPDRDTWARWVEHDIFERHLVPMGADRACKNPARLSRMPGHERTPGAVQRLLYLNPGNTP